MSTPRLTAKNYVRVWAALLLLLLATWVVAQFDLGLFNNVVGLGIAFGKMTLVVLYFMHVRYEKPLTWIFAAAGLIWLLILVDLTLADYLTRSGPIHETETQWGLEPRP